MPSSNDRIKRLNEILTTLQENSGRATFKQIFGQMALEHGTTEKTFWNYLETLKMAGKINYPDAYFAAQKESLEISLC